MCPRDGIVSEITYTYENHEEGQRIHSISFICSSSLGLSDAGTFGEIGALSKVLKCKNPKEHIRYIYGKAGQFVSEINVACGSMSKKSSNDSVHIIGDDKQIINRGGVVQIDPFDDRCYSTYDRRPVKFRIWYDKFVNAIHVKYENVPVAASCKISHVQMMEQDIHITTEANLEVIGFTTGSTCSTLQQEISLDISHNYGFTYSHELGTSYDEQENRMYPFEITTGYSNEYQAKLVIPIDTSLTDKDFGNTTLLEVSYSNETQYATGTTIRYMGPGIAMLVGYKVRHLVDNKNIPVYYHYSCTGGGSKPFEKGTMNLHGKVFEYVFFLDFQFTFNTTEECSDSSYAQECVANIEIKNFITNPDQLEKEFYRCFDPAAVRIPFLD